MQVPQASNKGVTWGSDSKRSFYAFAVTRALCAHGGHLLRQVRLLRHDRLVTNEEMPQAEVGYAFGVMPALRECGRHLLCQRSHRRWCAVSRIASSAPKQSALSVAI
jgi:hypothetical protein